ncbi:hypothetical protein [Corynebacterium liangguodongii]|nr:hypothetical protein [Corynebacterium liangguodongii]
MSVGITEIFLIAGGIVGGLLVPALLAVIAVLMYKIYKQGR